MKTKMIVLFLLRFYFVSAYQVPTQRKNVSCHEIQTKGGYFYKIDPCTEGAVVIEQNQHVIGRAMSGKFSSTDLVILTNESGIVTKYCENTLAEFHGCDKTSVARIEYYPTNDTSNNGAPGSSSHPNVTHPIANDTYGAPGSSSHPNVTHPIANDTYGAPGSSSHPNVTHPIANDTLKNAGLGVVVPLVIGVAVAVALCIRKRVKRRKPDNHEGNGTAMQPLNAVTEANQDAQA